MSKSGTLRMTDRGFGLVLTEPGTPAPTVYSREYVWDEENRLARTVDSNLTVDYRYGADGQRAVKYSSRGESLYFDSMWQAQTDAPSLRQSKHIYVGSTRIATQLNIQGQLDVGYETVNTYYYHPDHLGSSQLVTDYQGNQYEHVEYTPYGESWIDQESDSRALLPYKFTSKELDSETGLYYYGARYLNPRTSRWVSADPALSSLMKPDRQGYSLVEGSNAYSYTSNNPIAYSDPLGLSGQPEDQTSAPIEPTWIAETITVYDDGDELKYPILELTVAVEKQTWKKGDKVVAPDYTGKVWYDLSVDPAYGFTGEVEAGSLPVGKNDAGKMRTAGLGMSLEGTITKNGNLVKALGGIIADLAGPGAEGTPLLFDIASAVLSGQKAGKTAADTRDPVSIHVSFDVKKAGEEGFETLQALQEALFPANSRLVRVSGGSIQFDEKNDSVKKRVDTK